MPKEGNQLPMDLLEKVHTAISTNPEPWRASPDEQYGIRPLNPNNSEETQRFTDIDRHPKALANMIPPEASDPDAIDFLINADQTNQEDPRLIFGIVDKENQLVGWVQYYLEENPDRLREQIDIPENALVLEISYSKLFNIWPEKFFKFPEKKPFNVIKEKFSRKEGNDLTNEEHFLDERTNLPEEQAKGVAINGVRQALLKLKEMEETIANKSGLPPRPIYVSAYTYTDNGNSIRVLIQNGFQKLDKTIVDDEGIENHAWVKRV